VKGGELKSVNSKISTKAPNAVGNFRRSHSRTNLQEIKERIAEVKAEDTQIFTCKPERKRRRREFHYNLKKLTMVAAGSLVLGFLRLTDCPFLSLEGVLYLYR